MKTLRAAEADQEKDAKEKARNDDGQANGRSTLLTESDIREGLQSIDTMWDHLYHAEQARLLQLFVKRIRVEPEGIHITIRTNGIHSFVLDLKANRPQTKDTAKQENAE